MLAGQAAPKVTSIALSRIFAKAAASIVMMPSCYK
jgi:hypothetical protein